MFINTDKYLSEKEGAYREIARLIEANKELNQRITQLNSENYEKRVKADIEAQKEYKKSDDALKINTLIKERDDYKLKCETILKTISAMKGTIQ